MSFPRYPAYKDSGVEWLGQVPGHWDVLALKKLFQIIGGSTPKSDTELFWDGDILWATPSDLSKRDSIYMNDTQRKITAAGLASCGTTLVPAGSIVLSTRAPIGSLAIAETEMCTNQGCKSLVPSDRASTEYFAHLLSISSTELNIRGKGTTFLEISGDELGAFKIPTPPLAEQTQISAFLDRETAKIDALVVEQRLLMALLKEKRHAVISHAVTRGLNPHAPMKPSGIEWLGDVPAHWDCGGLTKFIGPIVDYRGRTPIKQDDGVFLVTARNIKNGKIEYEASEEYVDPDSAESLLQRGRPEVGDLLFTMEAPLGQVALIDRTDIALAQRIVKFRGKSKVMSSNFLLLWLMSEYCQARLLTLATGSTALGIKSSKLGMIDCLVPPISEQGEIAAFIDSETVKMDKLVCEAQRAIDLLQERRTALISAAVTGQIDVRGAVESL